MARFGQVLCEEISAAALGLSLLGGAWRVDRRWIGVAIKRQARAANRGSAIWVYIATIGYPV